MKSTNSEIKDQVINLLGISEQEYNDNIYETGLKYLEHYIPDESPKIIRQIIGSAIFWNWWKLHWEKRDQAFCESQVIRLKERELRMIYHELHNPVSLAEELYANGVMLGESYQHMMQELKEEVMAS